MRDPSLRLRPEFTLRYRRAQDDKVQVFIRIWYKSVISMSDTTWYSVSATSSALHLRATRITQIRRRADGAQELIRNMGWMYVRPGTMLTIPASPQVPVGRRLRATAPPI